MTISIAHIFYLSPPCPDWVVGFCLKSSPNTLFPLTQSLKSLWFKSSQWWPALIVSLHCCFSCPHPLLPSTLILYTLLISSQQAWPYHASFLVQDISDWHNICFCYLLISLVLTCACQRGYQYLLQARSHSRMLGLVLYIWRLLGVLAFFFHGVLYLAHIICSMP